MELAFKRYAIIILDVLYQMLKEAFPVMKKKMIRLSCNSGQPLLSLARATAGGFSLLLRVGHTQRVEFTEKACGVLYELLAVTEQSRWPLASRTSVCTAWLVHALMTTSNMVCIYMEV